MKEYPSPTTEFYLSPTPTGHKGTSTIKEHPSLTTEFYLSPTPTGHKGTSTINPPPPPNLIALTGTSTIHESPPTTVELIILTGGSTIREGASPATELITPTRTSIIHESPPTSTIYEDPSPTRDTLQVMKPREMVAWVLVALLTTLFIGLVTVNITVLCIYKQRQIRDNEAQASAYEMAGNPCYDACEVKQTTEIETNIYEAVGTEGVYM